MSCGAALRGQDPPPPGWCMMGSGCFTERHWGLRRRGQLGQGQHQRVLHGVGRGNGHCTGTAQGGQAPPNPLTLRNSTRFFSASSRFCVSSSSLERTGVRGRWQTGTAPTPSPLLGRGRPGVSLSLHSQGRTPRSWGPPPPGPCHTTPGQGHDVTASTRCPHWATLLPWGVPPCPSPISPPSHRPSPLPVPHPSTEPRSPSPFQSHPAPPPPVHPRRFPQLLPGASPGHPRYTRCIPRPPSWCIPHPGASPGPHPDAPLIPMHLLVLTPMYPLSRCIPRSLPLCLRYPAPSLIPLHPSSQPTPRPRRPPTAAAGPPGRRPARPSRPGAGPGHGRGAAAAPAAPAAPPAPSR